MVRWKLQLHERSRVHCTEMHILTHLDTTLFDNIDSTEMIAWDLRLGRIKTGAGSLPENR